ncbi:MarR family transcriptional regulator [Limnobacter humi]|uniref:MarR family transcriptional regulator n=1 Tax=Limnobacter humi TaxID=1778671 RepID=A0ABT1WBR8_9BURK|nr:MarR family transcriptional regulator [Limnobacter humi]MCQ8894956.1 MarR family transcriptional regulator [Limnobacter humi]
MNMTEDAIPNTLEFPPRLAPLIASLHRVKAQQPAFPFETVLLNRLLHFAQRQLESELATVLAVEGLLISHWMVLAMLYGSEDFRRRPQELSNAIGQSGPNTTKTTTFLMDKGWVTRTPDPNNKRSCWMVLSTTGRKQVEILMPKIWARYEQSLSTLNNAEKAQMTALLMKLFDAGPATPCEPAPSTK